MISEAKGELGFSYHLRQSGNDPSGSTVLLANGGTPIGIWNCQRLGTTKDELEAMASEEFDLFCTLTVLKLVGGDLTCP